MEIVSSTDQQAELPELCRTAGKVQVTLTRGQMNWIDAKVKTGLFVNRQDVLRYLIVNGASTWP